MDNTRPNSSFFTAEMQRPLNVQTLTLLLVVAVWETIGRTGILFADLFPPILEILQSLWRISHDPAAVAAH
jgi:ABC-type nitrate/sulfonate/bicarbonate transport system permease component